MIKTFELKRGEKPTKDQLEEVMEAKKHPIIVDTDCEELSPAMMKAFECVVKKRNRKKNA